MNWRRGNGRGWIGGGALQTCAQAHIPWLQPLGQPGLVHLPLAALTMSKFPWWPQLHNP